MTDLEAILQAIDALPIENMNTIRQHIDQRIYDSCPGTQGRDVEVWITNLHTAIDEFREGLSETELQDIVGSMNGYIKTITNLETIEAKIKVIDSLTENFWESFSETEINQIIADMNSEFVANWHEITS